MKLPPLPAINTVLMLVRLHHSAEAVQVIGHTGTSIVLLRAPWVNGEPLRREVVDWEALNRTHTVRPAGPADTEACAALDRCIQHRLDRIIEENTKLLALRNELDALQLEGSGA